MPHELSGKRIAILAADGVEQVELTEPRNALNDVGAKTELLSIKTGEIKAWSMKEWGDTFAVDKLVKEASPQEYDGLVLPGGVMNPDSLRINADAVSFVRQFYKTGKPIAAICHGPWTLIEAGVVEGKTMTSWPSLKTDLRNAGVNWVDEQVVVDKGLVTSRKPDDLPLFIKKMIEEFQEGIHHHQFVHN
jgi:protease I